MLRSRTTPAIFFAALWWVIAEGDLGSWLVGLPAVVAAACSFPALQGQARVRISPRGLLRFVPFFLWQSIRGGVDVALRTLRPRIQINPGFARWRTGLSSPAARVFFANCLGLLPGTLCADIEGDELEVHILNQNGALEHEARRLEKAVADLFYE